MLASLVTHLFFFVFQTQSNLYEMVLDMNVRQTGVEQRADSIEESLKRLQVNTSRVLQMSLTHPSVYFCADRRHT